MAVLDPRVDDLVRKVDALSKSGDVSRKLVIVRHIVPDGAEPANAFEIGCAEQKRGPERKLLDADKRRNQCTGNKVRRDPKRLPPHREVLSTYAVQARNQSDGIIKEKWNNVPEVLCASEDVTVVDQKKWMTSVLCECEELAYLWIACDISTHQELDTNVRKFGLKPPDIRNGRI